MIWSIRSKIILIGILSAVALTSLQGISFFTGARVGDSVTESESLNQQVTLTSEMKIANLEMVLAAMDSIIDKEEGSIQPERKEVIAASISTLQSNGNQLLTLVETSEGRDKITSIIEKIDPLAAGIQVDLAELIVRNAPIEEFARIDDVIDTYGEGMQEALNEYESYLSSRFTQSIKDVGNTLDGARTIGIIAYAVALVVLAAALFILGRDIVTGVSSMTASMKRLADGDDSVEIPGIGKRDEIGRMAEAVQVFKVNATEIRRLGEQREVERQQAEAERVATMRRLGDNFRDSVGGVVNNVAESARIMTNSSATMSGATQNADEQATAVATAAQDAAVNVQTVAAAAEELSSSINEISRQVTVSTEIAASAMGEVRRTTEMVQGLTNAADKIGDVVSLITDIAEQTNLLALNATIEAARAGDAGKGFAVVASEVKNLANQTGKATEQISQQIAGIQEATQRSAEAISGISETISRINEISVSVASAVEEQGAATGEIAANIEQAAAGTNIVSESIRGVTGAISETSAASVQIDDAVRNLAAQTDNLTAEVEKFLGHIQNG